MLGRVNRSAGAAVYGGSSERRGGFMGDFIEWDVVQPTLRARLMVRTIREDVPATLDDLRRGCEVVGLHVVGEDGSWKDQSIKDWSELAKRQTVWLGDVRKALDPNGISHADLESMASATVAARDLAMAAAEKAESEAATLRAQLDELRAEHRSMVAASLRELEVLRAQLAEAEARITKAEQEAGVSLDTLRWSYVDACERLGVDRGDLCTGISKVLKRAEKYCLDLGTMQTERDTARAQLAAAEAMPKDIQGWRARPADAIGWCFSRDFAGVVATFEGSPDVSSWVVERCAMTEAEWEGLGDHDGW